RCSRTCRNWRTSTASRGPLRRRARTTTRCPRCFSRPSTTSRTARIRLRCCRPRKPRFSVYSARFGGNSWGPRVYYPAVPIGGDRDMSVEARAQVRRAPVAAPVVHSDLVRRQMRLAWWLLLPSLLVVALVALIPLLQTIYQSFTNERLASARAIQFVGLKNYTDLLVDDAFRHSIWITVLFTPLRPSTSGRQRHLWRCSCWRACSSFHPTSTKPPMSTGLIRYSSS